MAKPVIGFIGLDLMGGNMVENLQKRGDRMVGMDLNKDAVDGVSHLGFSIHNTKKALGYFCRWPRILAPAPRLPKAHRTTCKRPFMPGQQVTTCQNYLTISYVLRHRPNCTQRLFKDSPMKASSPCKTHP